VSAPVARDVEILNAAAELFRKRGFAAVGVDEIGRAAGVTGPAIYRHFKGKDDILGALFDEGMDEVFRVTAGSFEDPEQELRHIAHQHALHVLHNPRLSGIWIHEERSLNTQHRRRYYRRARKYVERWCEVVQRWRPEASEDDVLTAVYTAIGALNSIGEWPKSIRNDRQAKVLTEMVVHSMGALAPAAKADAARAD
jgi:AcrR family transcriptional regulator